MTNDINVVISADDGFAIGLAATVKSALSCLSADCGLKLFVLDGGITADNKLALLQHWNDSRLAVEWVPIDRQFLKELDVSAHITDATYYRLLAPSVLPPDLCKFIFLDADLLIRRDLDELWRTPMDGSPCLAAQDIGAPYIDSAIALHGKRHEFGNLVNERPIPNYVELGLNPKDPYFNGGVLVVDLDAWRREGLAQQMLKILAEHREHVLYWDQYALNVVLSGRWKPINALWNQNAIVFRYKGWRKSRFCTRESPMYRTAPWIVHFNWLKPWLAECTHPFAEEFLSFLKHSPWQVSFARRAVSTTSFRRTFLGRKRELFNRLLRMQRS
jgi:lipopolysaccharide biosynthesis glycosyltransferase